MSMKTCTRCSAEHPATSEFFYHNKGTRDGLHSWCKKCGRESSRKYKAANPEKHRESCRRWAKENPEKHRENGRKWAAKNPEKYQERLRSWGVESPKKHRERCRRWAAENPEKQRAIQHKYKNKISQCFSYRLSCSIRSGISKSLANGKGGRHWESLVGYNLIDLVAHLESQFTKGMTWENYGKWHVDHIKPVSHFTFETYDDPEFLECWSLWNLRPLWGKENIMKGATCKEPPLPLLSTGHRDLK